MIGAVPLSTILVSPAVVVPAVLVIEFAIGLTSIKSEYMQVNWPVLQALAGGSVIGTPLGIVILLEVPSDVMRRLVALASSAQSVECAGSLRQSMHS